MIPRRQMLAAIPLTLLFRSAAFPQMVRPPEDKPVGTPLFVVTVKGQEGFIDRDGQIAIEPTYQKAYSFRDGLAAVQKEGEWGFIDTRGRVVIEPQFVMVSSFSEGLAAFRDQRFTDPWGFIDKTGKVVIKPQFDCAEDFRNGIAKVGFQTFQSKLLSRIADVGIQCDERFIDRNGKFLPEPSPLHYATGEPGERIPFLNNGMTGFLNAQGEVVIEPRFQQASAFSDGLACARQGGLYGYIDKRGEWAIRPQFRYARSFSEGLAGVRLGEKGWGFIDRDGKVVIPARFGWVYEEFRHGIAGVTFEGKLGYINTKGQWVWQPSD